MTADLRNATLTNESLSNPLDLNVSIPSARQFFERLVTRRPVSDDEIALRAHARRGDRPLSSYRTLEDLMQELGD